MSDAVIRALTKFFRLDVPLDVEVDETADWSTELTTFPQTNLYFLTRTSAELLHDVFVRAYMSIVQTQRAIFRLSTKAVNPADYISPFPLLHTTESLRDIGTHRLTREQIHHHVGTHAHGDPRRSALYARYAHVRAHAGIALARAIDMVCAADDYLVTTQGLGAAIIAPSTVLGAGLGVIVVGGTSRNLVMRYLGPLRAVAKADEDNVYRLEVSDEHYIDGSVVCSRGNMVNTSPCKQEHSAIFECRGIQGFVRTTRYLRSVEIFADYEMEPQEQGRVPVWST